MVKFLVIRFSSIGDIVLTTPVIRCLKEQVEGAEVYYLTKKQFAPVLKANPHITKTYTLGDNFNKLMSELRDEQFDYIIDLHRNIRTARVKRALKRFYFSFDKLNWQKWLLVNFKVNRMPNVHIVSRYLDTLTTFSVEDDGKGLDYYITDEDKVDVKSHNPGTYNKFMVCVVGGGHNTKQIPIEQITQILNSVNHKVILLGGPADVDKAEKIVQATDSDKVGSLVGKLNINQSASVIQQAALILTPDTGMMHIASAFRKNIISVWGNTVPALGMYPFRPGTKSVIFEVHNLKCRPCSKIGYTQCPKKHFNCMLNQDYEAMTNMINNLLDNYN